MAAHPYIPRIFCPTAATLKRKSVLLLGPRRTGKTQFIRKELQPDRIYNLLSSKEFIRLSANPGLIREELKDSDRLIVVDEIQKLPALMDEIHDLIETSAARFLLTGSSARKLRRTHTSLMAGRARVQHLWPFTSAELRGAKALDLKRALNFGSLPPVYFSEEPEAELEDYTGTYLREEIQAEALTRKIESFTRFLQFAALSNGELVNFTEIGRDAQVPPRTIIEYFQVLEDTLVGSMVPPLIPKKSRKAYSMGKFYFFDVGVARSLAGTGFSSTADGPQYGKALEHFIFLELKAFRDYRERNEPIRFWRTYDGKEVDFIVGDSIAIEVKATHMARPEHAKGLQSLSELQPLKRRILISQDPRSRKMGGVEVIPVLEFVERLWDGEIWGG
ncbi:MAG: AAA family ATPase [Oligoflexia bacterium]|nr:AAA family ATPase [Oligoflexia bacterium]